MPGTAQRLWWVCGAAVLAAIVAVGVRWQGTEAVGAETRESTTQVAPAPSTKPTVSALVATAPDAESAVSSPAAAVPVAAAPALPPVSAPDVAALLQQAGAAMDRKDRATFTAAFLALLDAGAPAYDAVAELLHDVVRFESAFSGSAADDAAMMDGLTARLRPLGGFIDYILQRPGEDQPGAVMFLGAMMQLGARSSLPAPRLLELLKQSLPTGADADRRDFGVMLAQALGDCRDRAVIPELEALARAHAGGATLSVVQEALARIGGREAMCSLGRLLDTTTNRSEIHYLTQAMGHMKDPEANEVLWQLAAQHRDTAGVSERLWRVLADRPENLDRVLGHARDAHTPAPELRAIVDALLGENSPLARGAALEEIRRLRDAAVGERRDVALAALVQQRDAPATEELGARLDAGNLSRELSGLLSSVPERFLRAHEPSVRRLVADPGVALEVRKISFQGLRRVDPDGAVTALVNGFARHSERERVELTKLLGGLKPGAAQVERAALQQILATDESAWVRAEAELHLSR